MLPFLEDYYPEIIVKIVFTAILILQSYLETVVSLWLIMAYFSELIPLSLISDTRMMPSNAINMNWSTIFDVSHDKGLLFEYNSEACG